MKVGLEASGYECFCVHTPVDAKLMLMSRQFNFIVLDLDTIGGLEHYCIDFIEKETNAKVVFCTKKPNLSANSFTCCVPIKIDHITQDTIAQIQSALAVAGQNPCKK